MVTEGPQPAMAATSAMIAIRGKLKFLTME